MSGCGDAVAHAVSTPGASAGDASADAVATSGADTGPGEPASDAALETSADSAGGGPGDAAVDAPAACGPSTQSSSYAQAQVLAGALCGDLTTPGEQDWYQFSFAGAGTAFTLSFIAQGDAMMLLTDPQGVDTQQRAAPATVSLSSEAGVYHVLVLSPSGASQTYELTLTP